MHVTNRLRYQYEKRELVPQILLRNKLTFAYYKKRWRIKLFVAGEAIYRTDFYKRGVKQWRTWLGFPIKVSGKAEVKIAYGRVWEKNKRNPVNRNIVMISFYLKQNLKKKATD